MPKRFSFLLFFVLLVTSLWLSSHPLWIQPQPRQSPPATEQRASQSSAQSWVVTDTLRGRVRRGDRLADILRRNGIPARTRYAALRGLSRVFDPRRIRPGAQYRLELAADRGLIRLVYQPAPQRLVVAERDSAGTFAGREIMRPLKLELRVLAGRVHSSLYESMHSQGASAELVVAFTDIFQWDIDFFTEPRSGDRFRLVYESYLLDGREVRLGRILAAEYVLRGRPLTAIYFRPPGGSGGYYDAAGNSFQKTYLKSPLNYRRISSRFSYRRRHPILKVVRAHLGVDFAAPAGTPVVAAADGVVIAVGYQRRGLGRYVKIRHKNRHHVTVYGHLQRVASGIAAGTRVAQRQVIGFVGATGLATGPHLHYSFLENGRPIDPLRIRNVSGPPVPKEAWASFVARRDSLLRQLPAYTGPGALKVVCTPGSDSGIVGTQR